MLLEHPKKFMKDLIIKAKAGDKKAIEEIIENYKPLINNTAISFYIYGYEEEDIKQLAILAIIKAIRNFDIDLSLDYFPSYVKKAVRNTIYDEIEKATKVYYKNKENKEIASLINYKEIIDENIDIQEEYLVKEAKQNLIKAISLLKEEDKELLKELYVKNTNLKDYSKEKNIEYHKARYMKDKAINNLKRLYLTNRK